MSGKMIVWNFSYPKNQTNPGHIPDMKKIWTKSGQINWTNSGHEKFQNFFQTYSGHEKILDKFWTNKTGHIPDMKIFWTNFGQIKLDKFWT